MYTHTFTFKLQKEIKNENARNRLIRSINNALLFSDQYRFGRNMTNITPIIKIIKNKVSISVHLFDKFDRSSFRTAENKFYNYLNQKRGYLFENSKYNKKGIQTLKSKNIKKHKKSRKKLNK